MDATYRRRLRCCLPLVVGFAASVGCGKPPSPPPPPGTPQVEISPVVEREVTDFAEFTARTSAINSVDVKPRVFGYLDKMVVKEGTLVKKGDVLFEIDPRPYQAMLDSAVAQLAQNEASLELAKANNDRFLALAKKEPGAVAPQNLNEYKSKVDQAVATVAGSKASVDTARLNLEWTKVQAPIDGRVSRTQMTRGNLVQSGESSSNANLISIVSVGPIYVLFDMDEDTFLRIRQLVRDAKAKGTAEPSRVPLFLKLANEKTFPHEGEINFVDNQVDQKTDTIRIRGLFPNADDVLLPGLFARVRLPVGFAHKACLVSDRAVDTDQGQKVVYVVDEKNGVSQRPVRVGAMHYGMRVGEDGLKPGERVVVTGVQQVRPGEPVEPKLVEMPAAAGDRAAAELQFHAPTKP